MEMRNHSFQFKQFTIWQDKCAMKVGTDGILLGAWVNLTENAQILDIGTGTGLLALILAQRSQTSLHTTIVAVEIDDEAYQQATDNIQKSPWGDRMNNRKMKKKGRGIENKIKRRKREPNKEK